MKIIRNIVSREQSPLTTIWQCWYRGACESAMTQQPSVDVVSRMHAAHRINSHEQNPTDREPLQCPGRQKACRGYFFLPLAAEAHKKNKFYRRGYCFTDGRVRFQRFRRRGDASAMRIILPARVTRSFTDFFTNAGKIIPIAGKIIPTPWFYRHHECALPCVCTCG